MKTLNRIVILLMLLTAHNVPYVWAEKQKIGVMKFEESNNLDPAFGIFQCAALVDRMVESGQYTVVGWQEIDRVLSYISKSQPNISPQEAKKQAMTQLGIQKMYVGSVTKVDSNYYVTVKVLNLDLSVDRSVDGSVRSLGQLEDLIGTIAQQLLVTPEKAKRLQEQRELLEEAARRKREEPEKLEAQRGKEIGRDGRFVAYSKGIVIDTETGLMWAAKDNGSDINYRGARAYCENYRGAGYTDWRMPDLDELEGLYDASVSQDCAGPGTCYVTRLIDLTDCCPWASDIWGSEAGVFYFVVGKRSLSPQSYSVFRRALPVRAGN